MAETDGQTVRQEDFLASLKGYSPSEKIAHEKDMLSGRYRIQTNQPLPALATAFTKAFAVQDDQDSGAQLYALVFENTAPLRQKHLSALKEYKHPHLVSLVDTGLVEIGAFAETRLVAVLTRPQGQTLQKIFAAGKNPWSEPMLIAMLLRPLVEILVAFSKLGISHNGIHLGNIYLNGSHVTLGECIGEPSGYSQDPVCEPIERMLTNPFAKPDIAIDADCYALAVVTLLLALGFHPHAQTDIKELAAEVLAKGSYHALVVQWDFPEGLQDLFRGLLNDIRRERWEPVGIESWLAGRHFNLITPSVPRDSSRGFEFGGEVLFTCKAVANALAQNWGEARGLLGDTRLARWVETGVHKQEIAEAITRIIQNAGAAERQTNEALTRIIILLDPLGPIRMAHLALSVDGVGAFLAQAFLDRRQEDIHLLIQIIENDLTGFWIEQQKGGPDYNPQNIRLQKVRNHLRGTAPGFGMERCMYEVHPNLPCQSPLVKRYFTADLPGLLLALDTLAPQKNAQDDYMDRHIAFIAAKTDLVKEVRVTELDGMPEMVRNPKLIALKLLLRAQQKAKKTSLKGLCNWVAAQLYPLGDLLHRRSTRRRLQEDLQKAAATGSLQAVAGIMLNPNIFVADHNNFLGAVAAYNEYARQIDELKNHTYLARHSRMVGRGISQTVAYTICLASIYFTLRTYYNF